MGLDINGFKVREEIPLGVHPINFKQRHYRQEEEEEEKPLLAKLYRPNPYLAGSPIRTTSYSKTDRQSTLMIPISKVVLNSGLVFAVPKSNLQGIWTPPDPEYTELLEATHSLTGLVLGVEPCTTLKKLSWRYTGLGLISEAEYTSKVKDSDVSIKTFVKPDVHYVTINWKSDHPYGTIETDLGGIDKNDVVPLGYRIKTNDTKYEVQIYLHQTGEAGFSETKPFDLHVSIDDLERGKERWGLDALRNLNLPGVPSNLPTQVTIKQLREIVDVIAIDIGQNKGMKNPLEYLV